MRYKLEDLIDIKQFQALQDKLNEIYSFPSAIIDNDGNILTATGWQDVCVKFHRINIESEKECKISDKYINDHIQEANPAVSYKCPHGLVDNATPIIIDGIHYGNYFTGQFLMDPPDLEFFKNQAKKYGFNEDEYLEAVKKVPIWSKEQLNSYLFFIKGLIEIITVSGLKSLREYESKIQLKENEEQFRSIFELTPGGLILLGFKGEFLKVNRSFCDITGYSEAELLSMTINDITHPDDLFKSLDWINRLLTNEISKIEFEKRYKHKDGHIIWVSINSILRRSLNNSPLYFISHIQDITERKKTEETLREKDKYIEFIMENSPIGFAVNTIHDGNGVFVSNKFEDLYGVPRGRIKTVADYFEHVYLDPVFREQIRTRIMADMATGDASRMRWENIPITTIQGEKKYVTAINIPLIDQNLMVSTVQDVTERKLAADELEKHRNHLEFLVEERTEELDAINKELINQIMKKQEAEKLLQDSLEKEKELSNLKSRFISTASHEFRTPLTAVFSAVELLQRYGKKWDDDKKDAYLEQIKSSVEYLTGLMDDVLSVSRADAGKMTVNLHPINLSDLCQKIIEESKIISSSKHSFEMNYLDEKKMFNLDPRHMRTILQNLFSNAIKYSPNGGTIELNVASNDQDIVISVRDEGIGIPADDIAKLFEPFHRAVNTDVISGTGLGLTIIKNSVDLLKGKINVTSELNQGTSFEVVIPILQRANI